MLGARVERDLLGTLADGRSCHVHGGVSGSDNGHALANLRRLGAAQVIQAKENVATRLAAHAQGLCAPGAGAHEDAVVTAAEEVTDKERRPDCGVVAYPDPQALEDVLVGIQNALRQAVLGNAITHNATDAGFWSKSVTSTPA